MSVGPRNYVLVGIKDGTNPFAAVREDGNVAFCQITLGSLFFGVVTFFSIVLIIKESVDEPVGTPT